MTSTSDNTDFDLVFSDMEEGETPRRGRLFIWAALIVVVLVVLASLIVSWVLGSREKQLIADLQNRTEILSSTRVEVLQTWLGSLGDSGQRLSRSDLFRLFSAEAGMSGGLSIQNSPLSAQVPYMIQAVTEYARQESLIGAYLVDRKGRAILASSGAPALTRAQRDAAVAVYTSRQRRVTPVRESAGGLTLDVILPVAPPQERNPGAPATVAGVFVFATNVQGALGDILKPLPLMGASEQSRLVQAVGNSSVEIDPRAQPPIAPRKWGELPKSGKVLGFGLRQSVAGDAPVFSAGSWVPGMPWLLVHEVDAAAALAALREFRWGVIIFAVVVTLLLVVAFMAFWWHQVSDHSRALANQYRDLGGRINAQRRFLENVMGNLTEMVGLKGSSGDYVYVNQSFAEAVGRSQDAVTGLNDGDVFGRGTAQVLRKTDEQARDSRKPVMIERLIHLPAGPRHLQFTKVPYRDEDGNATGILSVARDVTELREAEAKRQAAFQQMTGALVRTIEAVDPFLAGHTQNVHEVSLAIAEGMGLGTEEVATVDITAMLAQIGKVSIPKEIVAKTERLTPEEFKIMKSHVDNALGILEGVDFGLPVIETLAQIYERLDGSGYPNGLAGDQLNLPARILGIADVFCARLEPRSYRDTISPAAAILVFTENADKYDPQVVEALTDFVGSVAGEKLLAKFQGR